MSNGRVVVVGLQADSCRDTSGKDSVARSATALFRESSAVHAGDPADTTRVYRHVGGGQILGPA